MSGSPEAPDDENEARILAEQFAKAALEHGEIPQDVDVLREIFLAASIDDFYWWQASFVEDPHGTLDLFLRGVVHGDSEPPPSTSMGEYRAIIEYSRRNFKGEIPDILFRKVRREIGGFDDPKDEEDPV